MKTYPIFLALLSVVGLLLAECASGAPPKVEVGFTPPIVPVRISVDSTGDVKLDISSQLITPIGTFDITGEQTIDSIRQNYDNRLLVVRVNNKTTIYELTRSERFKIEMINDDSLYKQVNFEEEADGDIILELQSISTISGVDIPFTVRVKSIRVGIADGKRLRIVFDLTKTTPGIDYTNLLETFPSDDPNTEIRVLARIKSDVIPKMNYISDKAHSLANISLSLVPDGIEVHITPKTPLYLRDVFFLPSESAHPDDRLVIDLCTEKNCPPFRT